MGKRGPVAKPFWDQVDMAPSVTGCWLWTGSRFRNGYGRVTMGRRSVGVHRLAYTMYVGDPGGLFVCHRCDNKLCIRPSHLYVGTPAENHADMVWRGRSLAGEANPQHKLTAVKVREIRDRADLGESKASLARAYKVSEALIYNVVTGLNWTHV